MAKKQNNSKKFVDSIKNQIEVSALQKAQNVLNNEVSNYIKEKMQENEDNLVYGSYTPKIYNRRKDNFGLRDIKNNMPHKVEVKGNSLILKVYNEAEFNSSNPPAGISLAAFVNSGAGTSSSLPPYQQARPFMTKTQEDEEWKDVFKNGMKK